MGKKVKGAPKAPSAATAASEAAQQPQTPNITTPVIDFASMAEAMKEGAKLHPEGLSPDSQVTLLQMMHETFRKDTNAAERYHMNPEAVEKINELTAIGQVVVFANEVEFGNNPFAIKMKVHQIEQINSLMHEIGIGFNMNALPAPAADGTVTVPSAAIEISDEAKKALKEDHDAATKETLSPTDIKSEEELKDALKKVLAKPSPYTGIQEAVNFYQAYLKIQASKSENKDEELEKINKISRAELLDQISSIVGSCSLVLYGIGRFMYNQVAGTKTMVSAFCQFRNATKNKKTGIPSLDDAEIADYVRTLIKWAASIKIAELQKKIDTDLSDIETLSKDKKKNSVAIEAAQNKIEANKKNIEHVNETLSYVLAPTSDAANNFIEEYQNRDNDRHATALKLFKCVTDSYYDDVEVKEMNQAGVKHNVQQYIGIIINLFRDPVDQLTEYSEANITQLEPISTEEKPAEEKKPAEEETPKNE